MPYIAFEIDALAKVPYAAAAAGVEASKITHGLANLWVWCWRTKKSVVTDVHLRGFFGCDAAAALEAFGFLELIPEGFRVKGAERYLRVNEGRSKGGHASKGNLKRGAHRAKTERIEPIQPGASRTGSSRVEPGASREEAGTPAGSQPGDLPGSTPALTASSEQHLETTTLSSDSDESADPLSPTSSDAVHLEPKTIRVLADRRDPDPTARRVFDHWVRVMGKNAGTKFDDDRRKIIRAAFKRGWSAEQLELAIDGCFADPWSMGANDRGKAFNGLARIFKNAENIETFIAKAQSPLGGAPKKPIRKPTVNEPYPEVFK